MKPVQLCACARVLFFFFFLTFPFSLPRTRKLRAGDVFTSRPRAAQGRPQRYEVREVLYAERRHVLAGERAYGHASPLCDHADAPFLASSRESEPTARREPAMWPRRYFRDWRGRAEQGDVVGAFTVVYLGLLSPGWLYSRHCWLGPGQKRSESEAGEEHGSQRVDLRAQLVSASGYETDASLGW